jgi:hypothetical protein
MTSKTSKTTQTTSLSEAQLVLLSAASQRRDKGVARPESMSERVFVRAVNGLVKRGLVAPAGDGSRSADVAGHGDGAALTITDAGLTAIGVTPEPEPEPDPAPETLKGSGRRRRTLPPDPQPEPAAPPTRPATKRDQIIALLSRRHGARLDDLIAATGWLPHTTRAALTGLRQSGLQLARSRDEEGRAVYRIVAGAETASSRDRAA